MKSTDTGLTMPEHIFSGDPHSWLTASYRTSQYLNRNIYLVMKETDRQFSKKHSLESAFRKINEKYHIAKATLQDIMTSKAMVRPESCQHVISSSGDFLGCSFLFPPSGVTWASEWHLAQPRYRCICWLRQQDGTDQTMVCLDLLFPRPSLPWWNWDFLLDRFTSCDSVLSRDFFSPEQQFTDPKTEPSQQRQERTEGSDGI